MVQKMQKGILVLIAVIGAMYGAVTVPLPVDAIHVTRGREHAVFSGARLYGAPGQPELPVYYCSVLLQPGADLSAVSLEIIGLKEEKVGTFSVRPALPQATRTGLCWPRNRNIVNGKDVAVYTANRFCPDSRIEVLDVGKLSCFNMVTVRVSLARYNPVTGALVILRGGTLAVKADIDPKYSRRRNAGIKVPLRLEKRLEHLVVNFHDFADAYAADYTFVPRGKYVIITPSSIQSSSQSLDAFIQSKEQRDFEVEVVTESAWGGGTGSSAATAMRSWLADNYQTMGIEYVLIIGSSDASNSEVPMMMLQGNNTTEADFGYAQLTGQPKDDMQCEVNVGRIPVYSNDINTVDAILDKCIAYESADPDAIAWRENALFGAGGYDSSTKGDKLFEAMHNNLVVPTTPWQDYRIYGTDYGQPSGTPDKVGISTSIFSGQWAGGQYGLVEWGTHGSSTSAQYVMNSSSTSSVGNDYPAFVLCGSCSNASVGTSNNLTYSILKNCGIGAIGGTHLTYYSPGQTNFEGSGSDQGWVYNFGDAMMVKKMTSGEAINYLRGLPDAWWSNNIPYVLYGDPSLGIYTCKSKPYISIKTPVGGEEYIAGTTMDITWSSNIDDSVTLSLVKGTSVVTTIAGNVANDGEHSWDIPEDTDAGTDYKIQIKGDTITTESDVFTIKKKPSIVVETTELFVTLQPSDSVDKKVKITNKGEGALRYAVSCSGGSNKVLVNEIFAPHDEFFDGIELWNRGTDMDMTGWSVKWNDNNGTSGTYKFEDGFVFKSGATVVLTDEEGSTNDSTFYVGTNLSWTIDPDQDKTELSIAVLDANGKGVDFVRSAGNTDDPPEGTEWNGDGIDLSSQRMYRKQNEDTDGASDWEGGSGESSVNEINPGQTMDGVGEYWLKYTPEEGTVDAVSGIEVTVTFNAAGLENGDYYDTLKITHDDPDNQSPLVIVCKLTVTATSISGTGTTQISRVDMRCFGDRIYYQIPDKLKNRVMSMHIYDMKGKLVRILHNGPAAPGRYYIRLDKAGVAQECAAGFYLCRMKMAGFTKTVPVILHQ